MLSLHVDDQLIACKSRSMVLASADAARQATWFRLLLDNLGFGLGNKPLPLLNDNAGTVALSKNPVIMNGQNTLGSDIITFVSKLRTT